MRLSVIIPAYMEPYLQRTVDSLLAASELAGGLEVIVVFDGAWARKPLNYDPRVKVIQFDEHRGLRAAINAGIEQASGDFVMKVDAHCAFGPGFDRIMVENCADNWVAIPRRYALNDSTWTPARTGYPRDYHYLNFPTWSEGYGYIMSAHHWDLRGRRETIDDTMTFQGSCWMVMRDFYIRFIKRLDDSHKTYGPFWLEYLEVGLRYWLGGGEVKVNKGTWYAHLAKQKRHYDSNHSREHKTGFPRVKYSAWAARHWINNQEPGMVHPFEWLIDKFSPVPTWPADKNLWRIA